MFFKQPQIPVTLTYTTSRDEYTAHEFHAHEAVHGIHFFIYEKDEVRHDPKTLFCQRVYDSKICFYVKYSDRCTRFFPPSYSACSFMSILAPLNTSANESGNYVFDVPRDKILKLAPYCDSYPNDRKRSLAFEDHVGKLVTTLLATSSLQTDETRVLEDSTTKEKSNSEVFRR